MELYRAMRIETGTKIPKYIKIVMCIFYLLSSSLFRIWLYFTLNWVFAVILDSEGRNTSLLVLNHENFTVLLILCSVHVATSWALQLAVLQLFIAN